MITKNTADQQASHTTKNFDGRLSKGGQRHRQVVSFNRQTNAVNSTAMIHICFTFFRSAARLVENKLPDRPC
jgi:hypothetical protein